MCGNEVIKDRSVCDIFRIIWHSVVNIIWHTVPVWTSLPKRLAGWQWNASVCSSHTSSGMSR